MHSFIFLLWHMLAAFQILPHTWLLLSTQIPQVVSPQLLWTQTVYCVESEVSNLLFPISCLSCWRDCSSLPFSFYEQCLLPACLYSQSCETDEVFSPLGISQMAGINRHNIALLYSLGSRCVGMGIILLAAQDCASWEKTSTVQYCRLFIPLILACLSCNPQFSDTVQLGFCFNGLFIYLRGGGAQSFLVHQFAELMMKQGMMVMLVTTAALGELRQEDHKFRNNSLKTKRWKKYM